MLLLSVLNSRRSLTEILVSRLYARSTNVYIVAAHESPCHRYGVHLTLLLGSDDDTRAGAIDVCSTRRTLIV